jgi:diguanylate cyclase (GGDEF)-like protein/PAS domain S-box-containing protein
MRGNGQNSELARPILGEQGWVAPAVGLLVLGIGLGIVHVDGERDQRTYREDARATASARAAVLGQRLDTALSATYSLAAVLRQNGFVVVPDDFEGLARELLRYHPGAASLQYAPEGVVTHVVPLQGNEAAIGHDLLADPKRNKEAFDAVDKRVLTLAGPFDLLQGGVGAVARLPVFEETAGDRFWGFATVLIRISELIAAADMAALDRSGFEWALWRIHPDTGQRQIFAGTLDALSDDVVTRLVSVPNGSWQLSLRPVGGWYARHWAKRLMELLVVLAVSLLSAGFVLRLVREPGRLRREVARRTAELLEREGELRRAQAVSHTGSWSLDVEGDRIHCSDEMARIFGLGAGGSLPLDVLSATIHEDDRDAVLDTWSGAIKGEEGLDIEHRIRVGDEIRWMHTRAEMICDEKGRSVRAIGTVRDITETKRAEDKMREAAIVFDASRQGIMVVDAEGRITAANPAFSNITGYGLDEVLGERPSLLSSGRHDEAFYADLWHSLESTGLWEGEIWNRRKNGEIYPQWLNISVLRDVEGRALKYVGLFSDITQRKRQEEAIWRQANFDPLTGLANRSLLHDRLAGLIAHARRHGERVGLVFVDLDGFKWVNDTLGHDLGDELLVEVSRRLRKSLRDGDTVARLGGDEFTVVVRDLHTADDLRPVATKVLDALREPFDLAGTKHYISGSAGITVYPDDGESVQVLLKNADIAMYQSKRDGKNQYRFYDRSMQDAALAWVTLERDLRRAVEERQFELHYQPIVRLADGEVCGVEALIRWNHPIRGQVLPLEFVPVAENSGLILAIGGWVLEEATRQWRAWYDAGHTELTLAVNVSAAQFRQGDLLGVVEAALERTAIPPESLLLEITESVLMDRSEIVEKQILDTRRAGVRYAVDDFGTGYSSLSYLKRFPVSVVKIDPSFVRDCPNDSSDARLVEAIIHMAKSLALEVTAEGVETPEQLEFLRRLGCDYAQGYLFARPLSVEDLEAFIADRRSAVARA